MNRMISRIVKTAKTAPSSSRDAIVSAMLEDVDTTTAADMLPDLLHLVSTDDTDRIVAAVRTALRTAIVEATTVQVDAAEAAE